MIEPRTTRFEHLRETLEEYVVRVGIDETSARKAYFELLRPEYGLASFDDTDQSLLAAKEVWLKKWDQEEVARRLAMGQSEDVILAWLLRRRGYDSDSAREVLAIEAT